jgi:hypothetical protein
MKKMVEYTSARRKAHQEPSAESVRAIPASDPLTSVHLGRGPEGMRRAREFMQATRGRPRAGEKPPGSAARAVRLTDDAWAELERQARQRGWPLHKLLRWILAEWLYAATMQSSAQRAAAESCAAPMRRRTKRKPREAAKRQARR